ncbi:MAG: hypothetical protein JST47_11470 [Bacteroidetes bacterium]|nr:hypothetical protein [Bacteroidota bacterium]MBS1973907.1 hypothetical protein [Bacteroidota bacterium]
MATISTKQEILLMTGTAFSTRCLSEKDSNSNNKSLTAREKLEEACWNGLLPDLLPEICKPAGHTNKLYLWQIKEAIAFIGLELSEFPLATNKYFSIDPYNFITQKNYN